MLDGAAPDVGVLGAARHGLQVVARPRPEVQPRHRHGLAARRPRKLKWEAAKFRELGAAARPRGARGGERTGENSLPQSVQEVYRLFVRSQNWIWGSLGRKKQSFEIGQTGPEQGWMDDASPEVGQSPEQT